jgi:hypothetical protein
VRRPDDRADESRRGLCIREVSGLLAEPKVGEVSNRGTAGTQLSWLPSRPCRWIEVANDVLVVQSCAVQPVARVAAMRPTGRKWLDCAGDQNGDQALNFSPRDCYLQARQRPTFRNGPWHGRINRWTLQ